MPAKLLKTRVVADLRPKLITVESEARRKRSVYARFERMTGIGSGRTRIVEVIAK